MGPFWAFLMEKTRGISSTMPPNSTVGLWLLQKLNKSSHSTDICHACCLISTGKADNSTQVIKLLQNITNKSLSAETVCLKLKKAGWKAVVKKKRPMLSRHHRKERMDFAISHKEWT